MPVHRAEEHLHRAVARLALRLDGERRERHRRREIVAQPLRHVRHRVVPGDAARRPLPHLAGAVRGLAALARRLAEELRVHPPTVAPVASTAALALRAATATKPAPELFATVAGATV